MLGLVSQMGIADGGENGVMAEELLYLDQIDAGLDQVSCITVAQAVGRDLFFSPQASTTLCSVVWTPPASIGVVALRAPSKPEWRLGNNSTGLRCTCQKRCSSRWVALARGTNRSRLPFESRTCTRQRTASMSP